MSSSESFKIGVTPYLRALIHDMMQTVVLLPSSYLDVSIFCCSPFSYVFIHFTYSDDIFNGENENHFTMNKVHCLNCVAT